MQKYLSVEKESRTVYSYKILVYKKGQNGILTQIK